ncbi:uncharacterized protein K452DRAFT_299565 [Aplosporella prunicola CBS 121167]|uniref:Uncharacterized protein n=1 Tax=Aplosporella prunicola CBS 121167 TaxID=1176127 RepID=A0A6A6B7L5_9PEZI|nr:uncharacterized protein K452DRAFT_299565 [Aplosporella prunicola CBS 121167]KAF2140172.1 hypothetical protein K452DRAFT_299565 [Aplosporella prunicola CBS 121167]
MFSLFTGILGGILASFHSAIDAIDEVDLTDILSTTVLGVSKFIVKTTFKIVMWEALRIYNGHGNIELALSLAFAFLTICQRELVMFKETDQMAAAGAASSTSDHDADHKDDDDDNNDGNDGARKGMPGGFIISPPPSPAPQPRASSPHTSPAPERPASPTPVPRVSPVPARRTPSTTARITPSTPARPTPYTLARHAPPALERRASPASGRRASLKKESGEKLAATPPPDMPTVALKLRLREEQQQQQQVHDTVPPPPVQQQEEQTSIPPPPVHQHQHHHYQEQQEQQEQQQEQVSAPPPALPQQQQQVQDTVPPPLVHHQQQQQGQDSVPPPTLHQQQQQQQQQSQLPGASNAEPADPTSPVPAPVPVQTHFLAIPDLTVRMVLLDIEESGDMMEGVEKPAGVTEEMVPVNPVVPWPTFSPLVPLHFPLDEKTMEAINRVPPVKKHDDVEMKDAGVGTAAAKVPADDEEMEDAVADAAAVKVPAEDPMGTSADSTSAQPPAPSGYAGYANGSSFPAQQTAGPQAPNTSAPPAHPTTGGAMNASMWAAAITTLPSASAGIRALGIRALGTHSLGPHSLGARTRTRTPSTGHPYSVSTPQAPSPQPSAPSGPSSQAANNGTSGASLDKGKGRATTEASMEDAGNSSNDQYQFPNYSRSPRPAAAGNPATLPPAPSTAAPPTAGPSMAGPSTPSAGPSTAPSTAITSVPSSNPLFSMATDEQRAKALKNGIKKVDDAYNAVAVTKKKGYHFNKDEVDRTTTILAEFCRHALEYGHAGVNCGDPVMSKWCRELWAKAESAGVVKLRHDFHGLQQNALLVENLKPIKEFVGWFGSNASNTPEEDIKARPKAKIRVPRKGGAQ